MLASPWSKILIGGGIAGMVLLYFFFDPSTAGFFPPCPFKKVTGLECPGCGSQRALHALLHLRLSEAFRLNPLALSALPFIIYDQSTRKGPLRHSMAPWFVFGIVVIYWVLRNFW